MLKAFDKCFSLLERIDARLNSLEKREFGVDGERLLDNQDLCQLLNVDKKHWNDTGVPGDCLF